MRQLMIMFLLVLCAANLQADERLFFQPLNADSRLDQRTWRDIWRASADGGVKV